MNRFCGGHVFNVDGVDCYRCLGSGDVMVGIVPLQGEPCPVCKRPSEPSRAEVVEIYYEKVVVVDLGTLGETEIKWQSYGIDDLVLKKA